MTGDERAALRKQVNDKLREQKGLPIAEEGHGYSSKYRNGCRCEACTLAATEDRKRRRQLASMTPRQREMELHTDLWDVRG